MRKAEKNEEVRGDKGDVASGLMLVSFKEPLIREGYISVRERQRKKNTQH